MGSLGHMFDTSQMISKLAQTFLTTNKKLRILKLSSKCFEVVEVVFVSLNLWWYMILTSLVL